MGLPIQKKVKFVTYKPSYIQDKNQFLGKVKGKNFYKKKVFSISLHTSP